MKGEVYQADCIKYIGRYVDHELLIAPYTIYDSNVVDKFLVDTRYAWEARFQVPYMHCSCMPPEDVRSSPSDFKSRVRPTRSWTAALTPLNRPDALAATGHISGHRHSDWLPEERCWEETRIAQRVKQAKLEQSLQTREEKLDGSEEWAQLASHIMNSM